MKTLLISITLVVLTLPLANAQSPTVSLEHQQSIQRLNFLTGEWEGSGWMMGYDGKKHSFQQTESIKTGLDGVILTIEGIGKDHEKKVHHAFAIISADLENNDYDFQSFLFNGRGGKFKAKVENDSTMVWEIPNPNAPIRYTISVSNKTQWKEIGEINRGDGWTPFFEMNLTKKDTAQE